MDRRRPTFGMKQLRPGAAKGRRVDGGLAQQDYGEITVVAKEVSEI